ncbi:NAD-dependent histone deacetylase HST3 [Chaetomidium leptoderma]|uniref:NAD-dependent histone deacetylase HST3 n=1 Tax=Chaetomidium leptoderma TaxID=669021 RepID=A0AAN6ZW04_9PEZI|nr:NAD-dependent histone deacetylase HST3 [Chaetomidium leptoderma]
MPTTHVEPGCEPLLQDIANTLCKSRKVVVITGAGISTNSGIPDFRSENGLYSLIQAQFDAAEQQAAGSHSDPDASDVSIEQRPAKRQRRTDDGPDLAGGQGPGAHEIPFPGLRNAAAQAVSVEGEEKTLVIAPDVPLGSDSGAQNLSQPHKDTVVFEPTPAPLGTRLPNLRSSPYPMDTENANLERPPAFPSSPPTITLGTPRPQTRRHLLDSLPGSSSPLSSPPPVTFDPYEESINCSSSQETGSSRSQSEEPSSVSTPLLSSQTSFASSRASLPIMKGRDLFDAQIWSCPIRTSVFYTFVATLREKVRTAEPTGSHRFVSVLRDSRKLVRCYTQNIDQLEERVGLSTSLSLGVGSRYRFSVRAGRNAGGPKGSAKGAEGSDPDSRKGASQPDEDQKAGGESQPQEKPQPEPMAVGGTPDGAAHLPAASQPSQTTSDPNCAPGDIPSSTPSTVTQPSAPPAPNRGVECVFLHGSLAELRCFVCARAASWDEDTRLADTLAGRQPTCPHCAGATAAREERGKRALGVGKLRPDIVLYGEDHPQAHLISPLVQHDLSLGPDMLLILGTSMRVHGLKVLVKEFAKAVHDRGGKVVFVNFTKPPESVWADIIDYWVQWDCDAWVGDLQTRKPALWLPAGAAVPDEEKQKAAKLSRRQSGVESGKRKEGSEKTTKRRRESDGDGGEKKEESGPCVGEQQGLEQPCPGTEAMAPPPLKPMSKRAVKVPKEPKLNPEAKRPASIRDHKLNGAYLVWKITEHLRRITGASPIQSITSSPSTTSSTRPKAKRPRKSAPAALGLQVSPTEHVGRAEANETATRPPHPAVLASSPLPSIFSMKAEDGAVHDGEKSISAAVKSRRRKQTIAWRMIGGVETRVSLNDAGEPETPCQPRSEPILKPSPVPKSRRLPPPTPTTPHQPSPQYPSHNQDQIHIPPPPITTDPSASAIDQAINTGFRETDRLIAQMHQEERLSRPATPVQLRLAPLKTRLPEQQQQQHQRQRQGGQKQQQQQQQPQQPKLVPLEPKVFSPGPRKGISSNVGSPVASRLGSGNPFCFTDPLVGWLGYPPVWLQEQQQKGQGLGQGQEHGGGGGGGGGGSGAWCPDEQLRKEQEAALMLSAMSGRGGYY